MPPFFMFCHIRVINFPIINSIEVNFKLYLFFRLLFYILTVIMHQIKP